MKSALCYLPPNVPHHLDHLLPLAIELDLPVVTRCELMKDLTLTFYPKTKLTFVPPYELICLENSPVIISTLPRYQLDLELFLEEKLYGPIESIFCPHGLSDKELLSCQFQELHADKKVLLYGEKMRKEIPSFCSSFTVGNYRKNHFASHRSFYLKKLQKYLPSSQRWRVLFAPTWLDKTSLQYDLSSILINSLLGKIPENIEIVFKPHPNLYKQIPGTLEKIKKKAKSTPNLYFLNEVPYIYPLFETAQAYLGDTSSVGYDFLTTSKPIFSLLHTENAPLQRVAIPAPIQNGKIDWEKLYSFHTTWDPAKSHDLLTQSFADTLPLSKSKELFFEYLKT